MRLQEDIKGGFLNQVFLLKNHILSDKNKNAINQICCCLDKFLSEHRNSQDKPHNTY